MVASLWSMISGTLYSYDNAAGTNATGAACVVSTDGAPQLASKTSMFNRESYELYARMMMY